MLTLRFTPLGQEPIDLRVIEGLSIKKQRSKVGTMQVTLPNEEFTQELEGYGSAILYYGNKILFDGTTSKKPYGDDTISLNFNDRLWDLMGTRRIFFQDAQDITPSEAFTNAFDKNENFDLFEGDYQESYSTPWLPNYNASRFVVPSLLQQYSEFFDGDNIHGLEFMEQLSNAAYIEGNYIFYYWFENIGGQWYLFFQPSGWGKLWKNLIYTKANFEEVYEQIWNNVPVYGKKIAGILPPDAEFWTESNIDGWHFMFMPSKGANDIGNLTNTQVKIGQQSLEILDDDTFQGFAYRAFEQMDRDGNSIYPNWETCFRVSFWFYKTVQEADIEYIRFYMMDKGGIYGCYKDLQNTTTYPVGQWHFIDLDPMESSDWTYHDGSNINWQEFWRFVLWWDRDVGTTDKVQFHIDGLSCEFKPIRSANTSLATGYDEDSRLKYGLRTSPPVYVNWLKYVADCNKLAEVLVNYYSSPITTATLAFDTFLPLALNDRINFQQHGKDLTLPIDKINWTWGSKGRVTTKVNLGTQKLEMGELFKKITTDAELGSYDRGVGYYLY